MRYVIFVQNFRDVVVYRDTAVEAVKKAKEMISEGVEGVQITDMCSNRTYGPDEFHQLLRGTGLPRF
jgi:hypothetical protein